MGPQVYQLVMLPITQRFCEILASIDAKATRGQVLFGSFTPFGLRHVGSWVKIGSKDKF